MDEYRLRAPNQDCEAISLPGLDEATSVLQRNRESLDAWNHDFQGRSAARLRREARAQLLGSSRRFHRRLDLATFEEGQPLDGPLVVTGHQPELFHPGVWAKNFAAGWIARQAGGTALNLIVDNDIPRGAHVRVPTLLNKRSTTTLVDFDLRTEDAPYEDWTVHEEGLFASFPDRLRTVLHPSIQDPLVEPYWRFVSKAVTITDRIGLRFVAGRHGIESEWGLSNAELPLSLACESESFLWFVSHILAHLPRFRSIHNACLERYRQRYKIRSRHHPVADLHASSEWLEAPFWVWRVRGGTRRRSLFARQNGKTLDLRIDGEEALLASLPLSPDSEACCAVERLRDLPASGVRLRPRALTTTMFARLLVGDLFLHGIGGAKYDELGDRIVEEFFAVRPPRFLTFSMTIWPGVPLDPATVVQERDVRRRLRDIWYNPGNHLVPPLSDRQVAALAARQAALHGPTATRRERVTRFETIRASNSILREGVEGIIHSLEQERERLKIGLAHNRIAQGRDYALVVHSRSKIRESYQSAFPRLLRD